MPNSHLKRDAKLIDSLIRGSHPSSDAKRFQTVIHGDPKAANMLFSDTKVSFVDFQFSGKSLGTIDLAHILATSADRDVLENENELLGIDYDELMFRLNERELTSAVNEYTKDIFLKHYNWAILDWVRFMEGWGYWGNIEYAKKSRILII
jgi:thiamine kinase-like enzyme